MIRKRRYWILVGTITLLGIAGIGLYLIRGSLLHGKSNSRDPIRRWFVEPLSRPELITDAGEACPGAPFILPSSGLIGLLWRDPSGPYNIFRRHTGIDIFGDGLPGNVPVVAVYDGYLTRLDGWRSSVIIRHEDPLQAGRTIWTYYTHMADRSGQVSFIDAAFPPGTSDKFVRQGTLLGYQGEYSGTASPIGLHVHLSIVTNDADGGFKNEAILKNTLDPSPYFGMPLNIDDLPERPIHCP